MSISCTAVSITDHNLFYRKHLNFLDFDYSITRMQKGIVQQGYIS